MDKNYNKSIKLHCITCGDDSSLNAMIIKVISNVPNVIVNILVAMMN